MKPYTLPKSPNPWPDRIFTASFMLLIGFSGSLLVAGLIGVILSP